jgi:hypothetical protein
MKLVVSIVFMIFASGCISKKKYAELIIQKEKAEVKTEKLTEKLNNLNFYQKHLQDSLNKML